MELESDDFFDPGIQNVIVLDDLMSTAAKDLGIKDLFTEGSHHRHLTVIALNENMYFGKDPTQRRNCRPKMVPSPQRIFWLYKRWQPLYDVPGVEFRRGIPMDLESDDFFDPEYKA